MGRKLNFEIVGEKELVGKLYNLKTSLPQAVYNESLDEVHEIMAESYDEVPKDTGALADSQYVEESAGEITFGYGSINAQVNPKNGELTSDYAAIVHEDTHAVHPNGKAKFLEDPINRHQKNFENKIITKLKNIFSFLR